MVMKDRKQAVMEAKDYKSRRRRRKYNKADNEEINWRYEIVMIIHLVPQCAALRTHLSLRRVPPQNMLV